MDGRGRRASGIQACSWENSAHKPALGPSAGKTLANIKAQASQPTWAQAARLQAAEFGSELRSIAAAERLLPASLRSTQAPVVEMDAAAQLNERVALKVRYGTLDSAKLEECIRAGFDVNAALNSLGLTALHIAANWARQPCIVALVAAGADVNTTSESGWTPLHSAARHADCIVALLAAGADPNLAASSGRTPLHEAAGRGNVRGVAALLAAGANTEVAGTLPRSYSPLASAAMGGNPNALPTLLRGGAKNCIEQIERELQQDIGYQSGDAEDLRRARRAALLYLSRVAEAGGYHKYERIRRAAVMAMAVRSSKLPAALEIWVQHVADSFPDPLEERGLFGSLRKLGY